MRLVILLWLVVLALPAGVYAEAVSERWHYVSAPLDEDNWWIGWTGERRVVSSMHVELEFQPHRYETSSSSVYLGYDESLALTLVKRGELKRHIAAFLRYRYFGGVDVYDTKGNVKIGLGRCIVKYCELDFVSRGQRILLTISNPIRVTRRQDTQRIKLSIARDDGQQFTWLGNRLKMLVLSAKLGHIE